MMMREDGPRGVHVHGWTRVLVMIDHDDGERVSAAVVILCL